jgi:5-methylcytosine-specific restriction endonuclease McrA
MGATSTWKAPKGWRKIREAVFARDGHVCWRCGAWAGTIDHRIPVALGGGHDMANLRPACAHHNYSSGASLGNRMGGPRGNRKRGKRRPAAKAARIPAVASQEPLRTSRDW